GDNRRFAATSPSRTFQLGRFAAMVLRAASSTSMQPTMRKPAASKPMSSPPAPVNTERSVGLTSCGRKFFEGNLESLALSTFSRELSIHFFPKAFWSDDHSDCPRSITARPSSAFIGGGASSGARHKESKKLKG